MSATSSPKLSPPSAGSITSEEVVLQRLGKLHSILLNNLDANTIRTMTDLLVALHKLTVKELHTTATPPPAQPMYQVSQAAPPSKPTNRTTVLNLGTFLNNVLH